MKMRVLSAAILPSVCFMLNAKGPIADFLKASPDASLKEICSFVREHERDDDLSNRLSFVMKLRRRSTTPQDNWDVAVQHVQELIQACQENEKNGGDLTWLDLFGMPLKEVIRYCGSQNGVHGSVRAKVSTNRQRPVIKVRLVITRDEMHDQEAWLAIQHTIADFIACCNDASQAENAGTVLAGLGGLMKLLDVSYVIDKTVRLKLSHGTDKMYLRFSDTTEH